MQNENGGKNPLVKTSPLASGETLTARLKRARTRAVAKDEPNLCLQDQDEGERVPGVAGETPTARLAPLVSREAAPMPLSKKNSACKTRAKKPTPLHLW